MIEIAISAVTAGAVVTCAVFFRIARNEGHPYRIINMHYKTIKKSDMKKNLLILLLVVVGAACSPCRNVVTESAYMVWVQEGVKKNYDCVESLPEADAYIFNVAGLPVVSDSLIGKRKDFYFFDNGDVEIYVEGEKAWKKRGNKDHKDRKDRKDRREGVR